MRNRILSQVCLASFVCAGLFTAGCAHTEKKELDQKMSQETTVKGPNSLHRETSNAILDAKGLTDTQRAAMLTLKQSVATQSEDLRQESYKLQSLLVKEMVSEKYDKAQIALIQKRLRQNEDRRLNLIFDAVTKGNDILGRSTPENREMMGRIFDPTLENVSTPTLQ